MINLGIPVEKGGKRVFEVEKRDGEWKTDVERVFEVENGEFGGHQVKRE